jgi:hypothetical protein
MRPGGVLALWVSASAALVQPYGVVKRGCVGIQGGCCGSNEFTSALGSDAGEGVAVGVR